MAIRGIRGPLSGGYLVGRKVNGGRGAAQPISFRELARYVARSGTVSTQPNVPAGALIAASSSRVSGAVMLISGVTQRILTIVLPPGLWDVSANVTFNPNEGSFSSFSDAIAAISTDPSILPAPPNMGGYVEIHAPLAVNMTTTLTTAVMRIEIDETQPIWLMAQATFA